MCRAEDSEIPTCCANFGMHFVGVRSRLAPISSNISSVKLYVYDFIFCLPQNQWFRISSQCREL